MIIQEHFSVSGRDFIKSYSDRGVMIHGGEPEGDYCDACDPAEYGRTYTETEITIETEPEEALSILLGGE